MDQIDDILSEFDMIYDSDYMLSNEFYLVCDNHDEIFNNYDELYNYINQNSEYKNNFYNFTLIKNKDKITFVMRTISYIAYELTKNHINIL